ncbi:NUDIX hydrolase [Kitasatospora sp. NBC_01300]|uniref:NUDIX hydrolase n=1 Tax=Kitasatospora sp. NBC_01300 TaxID=2903574 RepID=UPI002F90DBE5|nr:NUDIX hydrolase [Kitasatospora sp. NBC_01300]
MTTIRRPFPPGSATGGGDRPGRPEELRAVEFFDAPHLDLVEVAAPALSAAERLGMDRIWARDAARNPALFDGPVIACTALERSTLGKLVLSWAPVSYRYRALRQVSAAWKPSAVFVTVLQPVTGGGLVVGRESASTAHPGRWQIPGGSVEPPPAGQPLDLDSLRQHAARELAEEVGPKVEADTLKLWAVSRGEHGNVGIHFVSQPLPEDLVRRHHRELLSSLGDGVEPELEQIEIVESEQQLAALGRTVDYLAPLLGRWTAAPQASAADPATGSGG